MARRLPSIFYNWMTAIGALISVVSFSMVVLLYLINVFVQKTTIYLGLLTWVILPSILVFGLFLIVLGAFLEHRRQLKGMPSAFTGLIRIDLQNPTHRNAIVIGSVSLALFLLGTAVGTYKAYQETESVAFCGKLCHSVMNPEYTAYQESPHARVACVECHIGPGADWFVKSKLSGAYQVYATLLNVYPRPIPIPIHNLRPAKETCEQCHWPEKFFGGRKNVHPHYLPDEKNTPDPITMLVNIGGGSKKMGLAEGIHWHMIVANKVEYVARDSTRQDIAWVRITDRQGHVKVFNDSENPLTPAELAKAEVRTMDCIDCHNRPSHDYKSPDVSVNLAMSVGWISPTLPYVKRQAVMALDSNYKTTQEAVQEINQKLTSFYKEKYPKVWQTRQADVDSAVSAVQRIYRHNFFPGMKVSWRRYPNNIGHFETKGCFRCHGDRLKTADGKTITRKCTTCHTILSEGENPVVGTFSPQGLKFRHPVDVGGAEFEGDCSDCHTGGADLY